MARINTFQIENFKGIEDTTIQLVGRTSTPIITLVGLNESGKTTLLEALSHFVSGDSIVTKIFEGEGASSEALSLIPIQKKANFTGSVTVNANVQFDPDEVKEIAELAIDKCALEIDQKKLANPFKVTKQYQFQDGNVVKNECGTRWELTIFTKKPDEEKFSIYEKEEEEKEEEEEESKSDLKGEIWNYLHRRLPSISYFPTFLVNMPSRIYLSEHADESAPNRYYRSVLQDVLDSLDEGLILKKHVAERIAKYKEEEDNPNWFSAFWGTPGRTQIDAVFQKISNAISKEIIGSWNKVFHRPISAKGIQVSWQIDTQKDNLPYAEISISDGESQYALHERSLGFRWFFCFLLFTRFKQARDRQTIFLFDEPAANLHARAQAELLDSFEKIIEGGHKVIYSTHSHYMINPKWLSGTFIIENEAIDYDSDDNGTGLDSRPTKIHAIPYKRFVSDFPDRVSYYQPIMEKLKFSNPKISPDKPVILTEGISDFHAFGVISHSKLKKASFCFVPGMGAGASAPIIALLLASARPFVILLDDDKEGKKQCERYKKTWMLSNQNCVTLGDLSQDFKNAKLESLLSGETHKKICAHFSKEGNTASKKEIGIYFAELSYLRRKPSNTSAATKDKIDKLIEKLEEKIKVAF